LARPLNKLLARTWWMGSWLAVYQPGCPGESRTKELILPSSRRRRNRRGCRSKRGGRKRRALAGAAPEIPHTEPSKHGTGKCSKRRFERKQAYSATLIKFFSSLSKKRAVMKEKIRSLSNNAVLDVDMYHLIFTRQNRNLTKLRRSWFSLAKTSGDSHEFIQLRFRVLVLGIDEFSQMELRKLSPAGRAKLRKDWLGELVPEVVETPPERKKDVGIACPSCGTVSSSKRLCRTCGVDKSDPGRDPLAGSSYLRGGKFGSRGVLPRGVGRGVQVGVFDGPAVPYQPQAQSREIIPSRGTSVPKRGRKVPARPSSKK
jgi:hypothetical protein